MKSLLRATGVALLLAMTSCGVETSTLTGSLERFYKLGYTQVRARLYASELSIEYVNENGEVPVRITVLRSPRLARERVFTLPEEGRVNGRVRDTDLPEMNDGTVTLTTFTIEPGAVVTGEFGANFQVGKDTAALAGTFETTLEIIDQVPGYDLGIELDLGDMDMSDMDMSDTTEMMP